MATSTASLRLEIYDALEERSWRTIQGLACCLDSSALVKRYLVETGTPWVQIGSWKIHDPKTAARRADLLRNVEGNFHCSHRFPLPRPPGNEKPGRIGSAALWNPCSGVTI